LGDGKAVIDWFRVAFHALWIIGCALILAALSYANWLAHLRGVRTRQLLSVPAFQFPFSIGLGLISCGLGLLSRGWLEHLLWAILAFLFAWQAWNLWRGGKE
jgi:hypothetical protein